MDGVHFGDRDYYEARAEAEIDAAHRATHPAAARAHYVLAAYYLDLAHNPDSGGVIAFANSHVEAQDRSSPGRSPGAASAFPARLARQGSSMFGPG
jgi:hypothetical protein